MTNYEIEAFLNVIKCGSISAAAHELFITQPALSRRVHSLEKELGFSLFIRGKGIRNTELTEKGKEFVSIANKWNELLRDTKSLSNLPIKNSFKVASVDSWSSYLFPSIFREFIETSARTSLSVFMQHSFEAYENVAKGQLDIAFISDDMYSKYVKTIPLFKEEMCYITTEKIPNNTIISPKDLNPEQEIRLPWDPECDSWHEYWFGSGTRHLVMLDKMSLLEEFIMIKNSWAIAPRSAVDVLCKRLPINSYTLTNPPPDRICYYIEGDRERKVECNILLELLLKNINGIMGITVLM